MAETRQPWFRRVPWWLWIAFAVILIGTIIFTLTARGPAVDEVSSPVSLSDSQLRV